MKIGSIIEIVDLQCSCGNKEGEVVRNRIEGRDGRLLAEVACTKCKTRFLIPDKNEEELRKILKEKYRPTWYMTDNCKIIHWSKQKEKE